MGILDIFNKKKVEKTIEETKEYRPVTCIPTVLTSAEPIKKPTESKKESLPELSLLELGEVDWAEFGARLKRSQLLPPSYDRNPDSVKISLHKDNSPKVEIVFKSTTSDSYRTYKIYGDRIHEFVNGATGANTSQAVINEWLDFKKHIQYRLKFDRNREVYAIQKEGEKLKSKAEGLINIQMIFDEEQSFLEKHKDDVYDFFGYMYDEESEIPFFTVPYKTNNEKTYTADMVTPFSPKTLEFCVSRLDAETKFENAETEEDIEFFIQKCNNLASKSIYKTDKWEKTTNLLVEMLKKHAEEYRKEHPEETENEKK